ncbi:MAG: helix-turn-helix domain-containing protein [Spirochaetota bacterium]
MHRRSCWVAYQSLVAGIRARRRQLRVSQEALGSMAGLHRNTVRLLESGQTDATLLTVVLERFGRSIAERRREAGLTQERLAERTGLHPHTIGEIERGLEDPTVSTVLALYETLGVHELAPAPEGLALS